MYLFLLEVVSVRRYISLRIHCERIGFTMMFIFFFISGNNFSTKRLGLIVTHVLNFWYLANWTGVFFLSHLFLRKPYMLCIVKITMKSFKYILQYNYNITIVSMRPLYTLYEFKNWALTVSYTYLPTTKYYKRHRKSSRDVFGASFCTADRH